MQFKSKSGAIPGKNFDNEVPMKPKPVVSTLVEAANKKRVSDLKAGRRVKKKSS